MADATHFIFTLGLLVLALSPLIWVIDMEFFHDPVRVKHYVYYDNNNVVIRGEMRYTEKYASHSVDYSDIYLVADSTKLDSLTCVFKGLVNDFRYEGDARRLARQLSLDREKRLKDSFERALKGCK